MKQNKRDVVKKLFVFGALALAISALLVISAVTLANDASDIPAVKLSEHYGAAKLCTSNDPGCDCPVDTDPSCGD